ASRTSHHYFVAQAGERVELCSGMNSQIHAVVHVQKLVAADEHRTRVVNQARVRLKIDCCAAIGHETILDVERGESVRVNEGGPHPQDAATTNDRISQNVRKLGGRTVAHYDR